MSWLNFAPFCRLRVLIGYCLCASLVGCTGEDPRITRIESYAKLPTAIASESPELRDAITRLKLAGNLPSQLARSEQSATAGTTAKLPAADNAAAAAAAVLNPPLRTALNKPLERWLDRGWFRFETQEVVQITQLLNRHERRIEQLRTAGESPDASFPLGLELGFFASTSYLDDAAIACRFDLVSAGLRLEAGQISDAVEQLERAAKWITWLVREPRLEPRLLGAQLREEWLLAVAAIAEHPSTLLVDYAQLREVIVGWLNNWPADSASINGDRAATLHSYEAIRGGLLDQLATEDELRRLSERGITPQNLPPPTQIDRDQVAYLNSLQRLISSLRRPYPERVKKHTTVAALLEDAGDAPFASEMFLPGLPSALEALAIDRAATELWGLTLSAAGGFRLTEYRTNPHSGAAYEIQRIARSLIVKPGDPAIRDAFALIRAE